MASPTAPPTATVPPASPPTPPLPDRIPAVHNVALFGTILIPFAALLPPRRLDLRNMALFATWSLCANQIAYEYTGTSIVHRSLARASDTFPTGLPEGAKRTQQLIREQKERDAAAAAAKVEEAAREEENDSRKKKEGGVLHEVWMGGETEGWRERRQREDAEKLEEGGSIMGIIVEQIGDVFSGNWGAKASKDKDGDAKPK